jgi:hypothetical protein
MDQNDDFSALRQLLASTRLDLPQDTQVDQFLAEFHHRQRVQMLTKQSLFARATGWVTEKVSGLELLPSRSTLSYALGAAAITAMAVIGLSQQVQVVTQSGGQSALTFRMPSHDTSFAMMPASFSPLATTSPKLSDSASFTPNRTDAAATRYVLANNSPGAYDKTVAF